MAVFVIVYIKDYLIFPKLKINIQNPECICYNLLSSE